MSLYRRALGQGIYTDELGGQESIWTSLRSVSLYRLGGIQGAFIEKLEAASPDRRDYAQGVHIDVVKARKSIYTRYRPGIPYRRALGH